MKNKKILCAFLATIAVCTAGLTACSGTEDSSSTPADNKTSSTQDASDGTEKADVLAVAEKLKTEITYVDTLNELTPEMTQKLIGVSEDLYTTGIVYVGSGGATAEEIACFEAIDEESASKIQVALEARVEAQKVSFENYQPKEMEKLGSPVIKTIGNCVYMCISDDNVKAEEIIG